MTGGGEFFFLLCGVIAIFSALFTVISRDAIRSAIGLLFHIVSLAGLYLTLHAHFLAAIQLIVYAGAVVVLFIFVIMLIGPTQDPPPGAKGLVMRSMGAAGILIVSLAIGSVASETSRALPVLCEAGSQLEDGTACKEFGSPKALGEIIFTDALIPFELVGILLLVAVLGAIAVARGRTPEEAARAAENRKKKTLGAAPLAPQAAEGAE